MNQVHRRSAAIAAVVVCGSILGQSRLGPPVNAAGLPVVDAAGGRITYDSGAAVSPPRAWPIGGSASAGVDGPQGSPPDWSWWSLGTGIGLGGLHVSTAGGRSEIVVACGSARWGGNRSWVILAHDSARNTYEQVFASPSPSQFNSVTVAQLDPTAGPEIAVLHAGGNLEIWNQASRRLLRDIRVTNNAVGIAHVDIDGDGFDETIAASSSFTSAVDPDGNQLWRVQEGGSALAIGQFDSDPAPEVALSSGVVLDATTGAVEWRAPTGFGRSLLAADVDGDGRDELIANEGWSWIRAYDLDLQSVQWSLPIRQADSIDVGDIDGDGALELLVGDGQWGSVRCFDIVSRQQEWAVPNPLHGVAAVGWGDTDGDGQTELIWGAGWTSSDDDNLFVADWRTARTEWQSVDVTGPFFGPRIGDLNGDGRLEMVTVSASSRSGYGPAHAVIFDVLTATRLATAPIVGPGTTAVRDLRLHDVDGDGDLEIVTSSDEITVADFDLMAQASPLWSLSPSTGGGAIASFEIVDLEGDGIFELVATDGSTVRVWDLTSRTARWDTGPFPAPVVAVRCVDFDGDGGLEIAALADDGVLHVVDGVTRRVEASLTAPSRYGNPHIDLRAVDGSPAVVLLDPSGGVSLVALEGSRYRPIGPVALVNNGPVRGLATVPRAPWFVATGADVMAVVEGVTNLWVSHYADFEFGTHVEFHPSQPMVLTTTAGGVVGFRPVF